MSQHVSYGQPGQRVVVRAFGENPLDAIEHQLALEPQPPPDPAGLARDDVVVAVHSAAVGWVDLLMTSGQYQHAPEPPYTPGMEYSGVVAWAGPDVDPKVFHHGARVLADGALTGPRSQGAHQKNGGFASYAVAPARALQPIPAAFDFDQACNLLGNYETAYHCLIARGKLRAGETVLVLGASGATGLAAVHIAGLVGARVIAAGRSMEKLEAVRAQGAHHVVCTANDDGSPGIRRIRDEVKSLTGGHGVDVVYDAVGGELSVECMHCAAFGARFLIVGWAGTPFVARGRGQRGAPNANQLPTNLIMMKGLDVLGCPTVISTHRDPSIRAERLERIMAWVADGSLKPVVSRAFALADVKDAMRAKWRSEFLGGCVLHPQG